MDSHNALRRLFRRCLVCPAQTPVCGKCDTGEICNLSTASCDACPQTSCVKISATSPLPNPSGKAAPGPSVNAGAIAGGVVGGVVAIVVLVFLVWKFCIKPRRQTYEDDSWPAEGTPREKSDGSDDFALRRDARASTHTIGNQSIASTVLSRTSNVIHIAYIPGVTNRSAPSTPGLMVPPVPQIPSQSPGTSAATTPDHNTDQFMFMPSDLRDSTYSGMSAPDRKSTAQSVVHRSSVATTIYRNDAVVDPVPARTVIRGKAAVVSVKSSGTNSPLDSPVSDDTPPVPFINTQYQGGLLVGNDRPPPSPAFSVNSTYQNGTANTAKAMTARPVQLKKSNRNLLPTSAPSPSSRYESGTTAGGQRDSTLSSMTYGTHTRGLHDGVSSVMDSDTEDEDSNMLARKSLLHNRKSHLSNATVYSDESSPFADQQWAPASASSPPKAKSSQTKPPPVAASAHKATGSLSAVIEEATRRASRQPTHGGLGSVKRDNSPFSDAHEVKTVL
ncbi:MAG: hypothetical protein M1814_005370 [Vezdaea aestivalis]|nr:MAG: hypothetical protein M1814_005370 [Vezdaea aestivalis]